MSDNDNQRTIITPEAPPRDPVGFWLSLANVMVVAGCVYIVLRAALAVGRIGFDFSGVMMVLLFFSELFIMIHAIGYCINFAYSQRKKAAPRMDITDWDNAPSVAVLMPARHEPYELLERTLMCLQDLDYPNKTIYFLDDSTDEKYRREADELALTYGARVFRRADRHGAKAGVINDCIKTLDEKYVVVFDSDQNPTPGFLKDLVPIMEANPKLAFAQTPQFYTNTDASPVAFGANLQHCMFYEYLCEGKSARGAMIFCGTNAIIRREALEDTGGLDERSITEDFSTTIDWHVKGWESLYSSRASVFGEGPERLEPYLKQQWRWSRGNIGVLKKLVKTLFTHPFKLTPAQCWEHFITGSYFLVGWAYFILMICPITYIFFNTPTFFMHPGVYVAAFLPYFALAITIFYAGMRKRNYSVRHLFTGVMLGFAAIPVFMKAAVSALLNGRSAFTVTSKASETESVSYWRIWPQIALWTVNYIAFIWGANRLIAEGDPAILASLLWAFYHFVMLSSVFFFRVAGSKSKSETPATQPAGGEG